jgi:hypothetical protein
MLTWILPISYKHDNTLINAYLQNYPYHSFGIYWDFINSDQNINHVNMHWRLSIPKNYGDGSDPDQTRIDSEKASWNTIKYCNVASLSSPVMTESYVAVSMREEDVSNVVRFLYTILPRIYKYIKRRHMYAMFVSEKRRKRRSSVEESTP